MKATIKTAIILAIFAITMYSCKKDKDTTIRVTSITIYPTEDISLEVGETITLTATVLPADAENKNIIWSSMGNNATVNAATGEVKCEKAGMSITIIAKATDGSETKAAKTITTIEPPESDD